MAAENLMKGEIHTDKDYAKALADSLNSYRRNKIMCDVILVAPPKEYLAHRNVLCASSPYLLERLSTETPHDQPTLGSRIELNNICHEILEDILNFMYIGEICVGEENIRKLISASDLLRMKNLKELSCRFYEKRLCPSNCLSIAALADEFNCDSLRTAADQFILQNFLDVCKYSEFKLLSCSHLESILSADNINVEREEQIFAAVMDWVHHDLLNRRQDLGILINCIRFLQTSNYFITDVLEQDEIIMSDPHCVEIIKEAKYMFNFPDRSHLVRYRKEFEPRLFSDMTQIMIACGGNQERMSSNEVLCYVPSQDFWYPLAPLLHSRFVSSSVVINNELCCIGGKIEEKPTNVIEKYNFTTDKWAEYVRTPAPICNHVVCIFNGDIFIIGGGTNETCSASVKKFSIEKGVWVQMKDLKVPRRSAAVATHKQLYVIGGYGPDDQALASVERYDPYLNEWAKIFPMNSARACSSAACVENNIFVFGGEYAMWSYYRSAEVFNVQTDEWKNIADLSVPRAYMGISCYQGKIYLIGGMVSAEGSDQYGVGDDDEEFVDVNETNIVESYDIASNSWKRICSLPVPTAGANCALITTSKSLLAKRCGF